LFLLGVLRRIPVIKLAEVFIGVVVNYEPGDYVEVKLPNPGGIDSEYHRETGEVVEVMEDDLGGLTGDPRDSFLYTVDFGCDDLGVKDLRYKDLVRGDAQ